MEMITANGPNGSLVTFDLDQMEQVIAYNGAKLPITSTVVFNGDSYTQTLTYDSDNLITNISAWELAT